MSREIVLYFGQFLTFQWVRHRINFIVVIGTRLNIDLVNYMNIISVGGKLILESNYIVLHFVLNNII